MLVAIVNWSLSLRSEEDVGKDASFCPKVTGPKGGRLKIYDKMYFDGSLEPHFPLPAIK